ncbi:type II toxin-antitoxin system RelE/ParE family toxin [Candidatus Gottesmanbacteria bacterium]|nr:type II toxin-antitoxin system RelE/ParE family toxin [Candidatus Gottesmanbacteria bacterium]
MVIEFNSHSLKEFRRLPKPTQRRISDKLEFFASSKAPLFFAEKLINSDIGMYRYRIGDYRVVFDIKGNTIIILSIGHRREIYK